MREILLSEGRTISRRELKMALSIAPLSIQLVCMAVILGAFSPATAYVKTGNEIPRDYHRFTNVDTAYKVHTELLTWGEAKQACLNEGGTLAMIDTREKVEIIKNLKGFNVYVWIGISRSCDGAPWMSAGSNTALINLPWAPGKPYGPHNCLTVKGCNRGLSNENCSERKQFVCQMPISRPYAGIIIY